MSEERAIHSIYKYVDGKRVTVWLVHDIIDVNGVLGQLRPIDKDDLQLVPTPPGVLLGIFEPGDNTYGVIEAGYNCPKCETSVKDGMGTKPFLHRFDYRHCLMAIRAPESSWNELLIDLDIWKACTIAAPKAYKDAKKRRRK